MRISQGAQSQELPLYVSNDGKKIIQGNFYDVTANPFKPELDKLKTQFQPALGTAGAPVVVVVFSDLQCPHCKVEAEMLRKNLIESFPTQVRLYFKDYPLEGLHPWAKSAAIAGRCVFQQNPDAFWAYHDWVFAHQDAITPENLKDQVMGWAKDAKDVDSIKLGACIDGKSTQAEVEKEIEEARALDISGTPTLFINGRRISQSIEWPNLKMIIDTEIEYQNPGLAVKQSARLAGRLQEKVDRNENPYSGPPCGPRPCRRLARRNCDHRSHSLPQRDQVPRIAGVARPPHRQPGVGTGRSIPRT